MTYSKIYPLGSHSGIRTLIGYETGPRYHIERPCLERGRVLSSLGIDIG